VTGDHRLVAAINQRTAAGLTVTGRAEFGELGGAIYIRWPDGRPGVVTRFLGSPAEAERTAEVLCYVRARGLPVPRHELVVDLPDGVVFVQERLPAAPPRPLTAARIDAMVKINDRFAYALRGLPPDVPRVPRVPPRRGPMPVLPGPRARRVLDEIRRIGPLEMPGDDLVHVDLTAANVLFDEQDNATAVVDWNLGAYRGDRLFALVKTRFDREWFVRSPAADPVENAAAAHLDEILADRIAPETLRRYWAHWLHYQLRFATRPEVIDWHLDLAESRLGLPRSTVQ